jgi:V/A-type H+/Na+-transporting ATPase subunit G/H
MATELVNRIRTEEAQAQSVIAAARADAEQLVAEAQAKAAELLKVAEAAAKRDAALLAEQARESGREEAGAMAIQATAEASTVRESAKGRLEQAVKLVMERIVNA